MSLFYVLLQPFPKWLYDLSNTAEASFSLIPVALAALSLRTVRRDSWFARVDTFLLSGFVFWFLGELTWSFYALILGVAVPYPSLADVFWIAGYPFVLLGMIAFVHPFKAAITKRNLLLASALATLATGLVVAGLIVPVLSFSKYAVNQLVVGFAYPPLDIALLFASVIGISLFDRGKIVKGWYWLTAGAILTALGDILFSYSTALGTYYDGHPLELFLEFGYVCFGLAIYERSRGSWER